ncbi:hypothetical protein [Paenibacillus ginsengihumi]|uniref:hypothetical protein n=1 Tax=Paenibacillus ginsengihumi TaxID=431596 RepID=UPI00035E1D60|nr:hypothetical protein [Paenibacillus ginsengihumi]
MNWQAIAQEILDNGYIAGVRSLCDDEQYEVGDECRPSYEWDLENDCSTYYTTGELAGGTCATIVDTSYFETDDSVAELAARLQEVAKTNQAYGGKRQAIIVGHRVNNDGLFDPDEVRIVDATVLAIIE